MVIGFTFLITYLNLLTIGYSFYDYLLFVSHRIECLFSIIGFLIINITIFWKGSGLNDLHL